MTIALDEDDDETRPRILSNGQILGYIARHWLREPVRFSLAWMLIVMAAACDLTIPWASRGLIAAVSNPKHAHHARLGGLGDAVRASTCCSTPAAPSPSGS